jgi:hypothetical protein
VATIATEDASISASRAGAQGRQLGLQTLLAVEQPKKEDGRPDGQDVKKITDDAADGNNEAKTDGEHCRTNEADYRNQRGRNHLLSLLFNWL